MANIVFVNTDNLNTGRAESVEVHSPTCSHLARYRRSPFFEEMPAEEWDSAQDFFDDYNADFLAEAGPRGTYDILFFPCSGLVTSKTVITAR